MSRSGLARGTSPEKLQLRPGDSELTLQELLGLALFRGMTRRAQARLRGKSGQGVAVLRRYQAGEVICREGAPGWTAYYLLRVDELLALRESQKDPSQDELRALRAERELLAAADSCELELARSHSGLMPLPPAQKRRRAEEIEKQDTALAATLRSAAESAERRMLAQVSTRGPAATSQKLAEPLADLVARILGPRERAAPDSARKKEQGQGPKDEVILGPLFEGELFGESSCLYHTPRSATVRALRDCYVLEFLGVVLELLLTSESFQEELNEVYRRRVLGQQLRAIPMFAHVAEEAIELLRQGAVLLTKRPGEVIYTEGEPADRLYVVRSGTVKLHSGSGGRVLGYRSRGEVVGSHDMLGGRPHSASCSAYQHPHGESSERARALDAMRVELVCIDRALFETICARLPAFRKQVERSNRDGGSEYPSNPTQMAQSTTRFNSLGLNQGRKLMLIDLEQCTLCGDCVSGCASLQHDGLPRISLQGPRFGRHLVPVSCRQCDDPACLVGCPVGAIHRGAAGQVVIEDFCIGCGLCAAKCPYEAIDLRGETDKRAVVCDQCAAQPGGPACVRACLHDAAQRVDAKPFFARARVV